MNIIELDKNTASALEIFKNNEYPALDREHYGDNPPNFVPKEVTLIIKEDEEIIGFITIVIKAGITYIDSLLVGAKYRHKGVGQQLVRSAEDKAKELGSHKIWLETGIDWPAKSFYEKLGYTVRTVLPNDIGHKDCVLMDKMLV